MTDISAPQRPSGRESSARIPALDILRGLAALAVCLYHFTDPRDGLFAASDPLRRMTWQGWLGVEVFFVISGFVIPYSMYVRSYRLRNAGGFLARRLMRLEPPYLACIVLILALNWLWTATPAMRAHTQSVSAPQLLAHLGYLNALLEYEWLNPVFWTLAIEFQFYIFMALVFPLIVHERLETRIAATLLIALAGFVESRNLALLPHWLPLFAIGIVTFQSYIGRLTAFWYVMLMVTVTGLSWDIVGERQTLLGLATAVAIRMSGARNVPSALSPLMFLGAISYSLYLVHIPIGEAIIHALSGSQSGPSMRYAIAAAALVASIGVAWVFWHFIEKPAQAWARSSTRAAPGSAPPRDHARADSLPLGEERESTLKQ